MRFYSSQVLVSEQLTAAGPKRQACRPCRVVVCHSAVHFNQAAVVTRLGLQPGWHQVHSWRTLREALPACWKNGAEPSAFYQQSLETNPLFSGGQIPFPTGC